ncbi:hypothetical protein C8Q77DRAFT_783347 [Trametes polyzona]|nr:hypothetical protein C8Q77DRAFT_783347 [Trametes polyzona]
MSETGEGRDIDVLSCPCVGLGAGLRQRPERTLSPPRRLRTRRPTCVHPPQHYCLSQLQSDQHCPAVVPFQSPRSLRRQHRSRESKQGRRVYDDPADPDSIQQACGLRDPHLMYSFSCPPVQPGLVRPHRNSRPLMHPSRLPRAPAAALSAFSPLICHSCAFLSSSLLPLPMPLPFLPSHRTSSSRPTCVGSDTAGTSCFASYRSRHGRPRRSARVGHVVYVPLAEHHPRSPTRPTPMLLCSTPPDACNACTRVNVSTLTVLDLGAQISI